MSYVVLARKLRPSRFDDLIGQETAAQTLRNAVISDRVAHAFLFAGSRGVGKTSAARILTRALNCLNPDNGDPCNTCENCLEINQNASPDVYEIDAASNRGIENIRELRENVNYVPARCRYKVYIIDEAHMLTLESFNALLKTLEEPPAHVKFIFATTDPYKVPATIISRCQRYDFLRIPIKKMADFLEKVVADESLELSRKALEMIARNSVGGMRDALTAIDQILSFTGTSATDQKVAQILGILDSESRFAFIEAILKKNAAEALQYFQKLQEHGHDVHDILSDLLQTIKTVSLVRTLGTNPALFQELSSDDLEAFASLGKLVSADELQQIFHVLLDLEEQMKRSAHTKICFEMAILQIASIVPLVGLPEMIREIQNIKSEKKLKKMVSKQLQISTDEPSVNTPQADASMIKNLLQSGKKESAGEIQGATDFNVSEPQIAELSDYNPEQLNDSQVDQEMVNVMEPPAPQADDKVAEDSHQQIEGDTESSYSPTEEKRSSDALQNTAQLSEKPPEEWYQFSEAVQKYSSILASYVRNAVPQKLEGSKLKLTFKSGNYAKMLTQQHIELLEKAVSEITGHSVTIKCEDTIAETSRHTIAEYEQILLEHEKEEKRKNAMEFPLVQDILSVFKNSKITSIELSDA